MGTGEKRMGGGGGAGAQPLTLLFTLLGRVRGYPGGGAETPGQSAETPGGKRKDDTHKSRSVTNFSIGGAPFFNIPTKTPNQELMMSISQNLVWTEPHEIKFLVISLGFLLRLQSLKK